jgi:hypothetical protein
MKRTIVSTTIPYSLLWNNEDLEILVNDRVFEVHFQRKDRQRGDEEATGSGIVEASGLTLPQDRLGRVSYTAVEIRFPMYVQNDIGNSENLENWFRAVINRLLEVYRYVTEDFHVDRIPKRELHRYTVQTIREDGTVESAHSVVNPGGDDVWLSAAPPPVSVSDKAQQMLQEGTPISSIPQVLYLNAKREESFENYRMAVVEAETAFEALVDQVVGECCVRSGRLSSNEVDSWLDSTGVVNLIKHHIPLAKLPQSG